MLSKALGEELLDRDRRLEMKDIDEQLVDRFDEAVVTLGKQIKFVIADEVGNRG